VAEFNTMNTPVLEKRIAAALSNDTTSADLASLIAETEAAISEAEATAHAARAKGLDLLASPDASKARTRMEDAAFTRDRLRTVLPRLREKLRVVEAAEYAARWEPEYKQVEAQRNEFAKDFASTYPKVVSQLIDLLRRTETCDREVGRINGSVPDGDGRRLLGVELTARGLDHFNVANPSIPGRLQLPDWERSEPEHSTNFLPHAALRVVGIIMGTNSTARLPQAEKSLSGMAFEMLLRRVESPYTAHGFRSSFRDWAGNETHFPRELAEHALAHVIGDKAEQAYRRSDALARRRELMEAWASHCTGESVENVLAFQRPA
jgi:hypothetical protein